MYLDNDSSVSAKEEMDKLNAISVHRQKEVLECARRTFCYRQATHTQMPFSKAVQLCSKYQTSPEIVSLCSMSIESFCIIHGRPLE